MPLGSRLTIDNFKEFHRRVPEIIKELNQEEGLAVRALVNPLLAIEELGYDLPEGVRKQVERFLRFRPEELKKLNELEAAICRAAGETLDPDSPEELERVLFKKLRLARPKGLEKLELPQVEGFKLAPAKGEKPQWADPLKPLKGDHPIIKPLLAYRTLLLSKPGFASRSFYHDLKEGLKRLPVTRVKVSFVSHGEEVEHA